MELTDDKLYRLEELNVEFKGYEQRIEDLDERIVDINLDNEELREENREENIEIASEQRRLANCFLRNSRVSDFSRRQTQ
jgi:peptidoglycan hydrolase CwlO-like protein